ncbi:MAG: toprim domain-containing protein [Motiliproteus sp.]
MMDVRRWLEENSINGSMDVMASAYSELMPMAESCGINWDQLKRRLPSSDQPLSARDLPVCVASDRHRCFFIWHDNISSTGIRFPVLVFFTHRAGGYKQIFNGLKWLIAQCRDSAPLSRGPCRRPTVTDRLTANTDACKDWRPENFRRYHRLFNSLPQERGNHPYLVKKLGMHATDLCRRMDIRSGADHHGHFISTPLYRLKDHTLGLVVGYQQIYDRAIWGNGQNRKFIMSVEGAKRGSFAYVQGQSSSGRVGMTEGIATALTIGLYRTHPIYVALGAGNLMLVAKQLDNVALDIFADNDCWKPGIGNVGLNCASAAALAHGNSRIYAPVFTPGNEVHQPTDFNDLLQLQGIDVLSAQLCNERSPPMSAPLFIAAYDIGQAKASRQALQCLRALSNSKQKSVFECSLQQHSVWQLLRDMEAIIDPAQDRFLLSMIDPRSNVVRMGLAPSITPPTLFFVD